MDLSAAVQQELKELAGRLGRPALVDAAIDDSFNDPISKRDRFGEVCMVVRRKNGKLLLSIKTFYPRGAFRLPTGGIHQGERVYDALVREAHEETGLGTTVERFLARIAYRPLSKPGAPPIFHTFAFLLSEVSGTLGALDLSERIEEWREVLPSELAAAADFLADLRTAGTADIGGDWRAWGKFRAVVHRAVYEALGADPLTSRA
jgi:8-oxo-dGTP pyrophosphatase MutT (NUDIX family)